MIIPNRKRLPPPPECIEWIHSSSGCVKSASGIMFGIFTGRLSCSNTKEGHKQEYFNVAEEQILRTNLFHTNACFS